MDLSEPYLLSLTFHFLFVMGLSGLEPPTSRLSGVRSNRLSYKPTLYWKTAFTGFFFLKLAATYPPTPSPVQYSRPSWA